MVRGRFSDLVHVHDPSLDRQDQKVMDPSLHCLERGRPIKEITSNWQYGLVVEADHVAVKLKELPAVGGIADRRIVAGHVPSVPALNHSQGDHSVSGLVPVASPNKAVGTKEGDGGRRDIHLLAGPLADDEINALYTRLHSGVVRRGINRHSRRDAMRPDSRKKKEAEHGVFSAGLTED